MQDLKELSSLVTEFSLLVHVSTNLQHKEAFLHPHVCTLSPCSAPVAFLGSGAYLTVCVAWQGSCERSLHTSSGRLPGPQRAPSPWREEGARRREDLGVGGILGGGMGGGGWVATRDASEQVENRQFTLSLSPQGWREGGRAKE